MTYIPILVINYGTKNENQRSLLQHKVAFMYLISDELGKHHVMRKANRSAFVRQSYGTD